MKTLFVIAAPSGGGKTTLCNRLLKDFPELTLSISSTTRAPRGQEKHARDYFFLSAEEFQKQIQASRFAEWALVHGNYYGTSKNVIEDALRSGKKILLDIDVQGAESMRKTYPEQCVTFFIVPPDLTALEGRLRARGTDHEATIQQRLKNATLELKEAPRFDHVIVNDELERAYTELKGLIQSYLHAGR